MFDIENIIITTNCGVKCSSITAVVEICDEKHVRCTVSGIDLSYAVYGSKDSIHLNEAASQIVGGKVYRFVDNEKPLTIRRVELLDIEHPEKLSTIISCECPD